MKPCFLPALGIRGSHSHFLLVLLAAFSLAASHETGAAVIFTNPITGSNPNTANPFADGQTVDVNVTVSGIGRGDGINGTNTNDRYNATSWNTVALDSTAYFTFTITPNAGYAIDFENFVYTGQASGMGPSSFAFRSSLDGFAGDVGSPTATGTTIDLSALAFQGITESIEFRLYGWGATNVGGTFSVNDFTFNGDVYAIPEPSRALLISLGALGLVLRRRRA